MSDADSVMGNGGASELLMSAEMIISGDHVAVFKSKQNLMLSPGHFGVWLEDFYCHFLFLQHRSSQLKLVGEKKS